MRSLTRARFLRIILSPPLSRMLASSLSPTLAWVNSPKCITPPKVVPASVEFVDIAGLVKGASKGEGLGNQFLANIRECQVIYHVVRVFQNGEIMHVAENASTPAEVSPKDDIEIIQAELAIKDEETHENFLKKNKGKNIKSEPRDENFDLTKLAGGKFTVGYSDPDIPYLTQKPVIYMVQR